MPKLSIQALAVIMLLATGCDSSSMLRELSSADDQHAVVVTDTRNDPPTTVPAHEPSPPCEAPDWQPPADTPRLPKRDRQAVVGIDHGHFNLHRLDGTYASFATLMTFIGAKVVAHEGVLSAESLRPLDLLVIANARSPLAQARPLQAPEATQDSSAFSEPENEALLTWLRSGGRMLLVADHMPFPAAARELARALGLELRNGYARGPANDVVIVFDRTQGGLGVHAITDGISRVASFDGHAFTASDPALWTPLLILPSRSVLLKPKRLRDFTDDTERVPVGGHWQGAVRELGQGRVAVFGEAAMFSAQRMGMSCAPVGLNHPAARENSAFLAAVARWLLD